MNRTSTLLQGPLHYIDGCLAERDRLFKLIAQCDACAVAMLTVRSDILRSLAPLTQVAVLFKIESARLSTELRETFVTVTTEIERMHALVHQSMEGNANHLEAALRNLARVRALLDRDFSEIASKVADKKKTIAAAIASLGAQLSENAVRDTKLHSHSRLVRDEVSRIVQSLQFQDIVHQKCEHILEALGDKTDQVGHHAALQAGHIAGVVSDLSSGQATILSCLDGLAEKSAELEENSIRLDDLEGMTASSDGIVQMLLDTLSTVEALTIEVAKVTNDTYEALRPMTELAKSLSSALVDTAVNMNHIALNAQIRSIISGEGTGLEQLSARAAQISTEVNILSRTNAQNLLQLDESVQEMLVTFRAFGESGKNALSDYEGKRGPIEGELHAIRDETLSAFQELGTTLSVLHQEFLHIRRAASLIGQEINPIKKAGTLLAAFKEQNPSISQSGENLHAHTRLYTMDSEREVHARVTGSKLEGRKELAELFPERIAGTITNAGEAGSKVSTTVLLETVPSASVENFELF